MTEEAVHVLVVSGDSPEEREYEIEHPGCPEICDWGPTMGEMTMRETIAALYVDDDWAEDFDRDGRLVGRRNCYVQYEVENVGLETLEGPLLPEATADYRWSERWRLLAPGRYEIRGWYTPQGWAGSEPIEADGGIELLRRLDAAAAEV